MDSEGHASARIVARLEALLPAGVPTKEALLARAERFLDCARAGGAEIDPDAVGRTPPGTRVVCCDECSRLPAVLFASLLGARIDMAPLARLWRAGEGDDGSSVVFFDAAVVPNKDLDKLVRCAIENHWALFPCTDADGSVWAVVKLWLWRHVETAKHLVVDSVFREPERVVVPYARWLSGMTLDAATLHSELAGTIDALALVGHGDEADVALGGAHLCTRAYAKRAFSFQAPTVRCLDEAICYRRSTEGVTPSLVPAHDLLARVCLVNSCSSGSLFSQGRYGRYPSIGRVLFQGHCATVVASHGPRRPVVEEAAHFVSLVRRGVDPIEVCAALNAVAMEDGRESTFFVMGLPWRDRPTEKEKKARTGDTDAGTRPVRQRDHPTTHVNPRRPPSHVRHEQGMQSPRPGAQTANDQPMMMERAETFASLGALDEFLLARLRAALNAGDQNGLDVAISAAQMWIMNVLLQRSGNAMTGPLADLLDIGRETSSADVRRACDICGSIVTAFTYQVEGQRLNARRLQVHCPCCTIVYDADADLAEVSIIGSAQVDRRQVDLHGVVAPFRRSDCSLVGATVLGARGTIETDQSNLSSEGEFRLGLRRKGHLPAGAYTIKVVCLDQLRMVQRFLPLLLGA